MTDPGEDEDGALATSFGGGEVTAHDEDDDVAANEVAVTKKSSPPGGPKVESMWDMMQKNRRLIEDLAALQTVQSKLREEKAAIQAAAAAAAAAREVREKRSRRRHEADHRKHDCDDVDDDVDGECGDVDGECGDGSDVRHAGRLPRTSSWTPLDSVSAISRGGADPGRVSSDTRAMCSLTQTCTTLRDVERLSASEPFVGPLFSPMDVCAHPSLVPCLDRGLQVMSTSRRRLCRSWRRGTGRTTTRREDCSRRCGTGARRGTEDGKLWRGIGTWRARTRTCCID